MDDMSSSIIITLVIGKYSLISSFQANAKKIKRFILL